MNFFQTRHASDGAVSSEPAHGFPGLSDVTISQDKTIADMKAVPANGTRR